MSSVKIIPTEHDLRKEETEEREEDQIVGEKATFLKLKRKAFDEVYQELYEQFELGAFDIIFCPKFQGLFFFLANIY